MIFTRDYTKIIAAGIMPVDEAMRFLGIQGTGTIEGDKKLLRQLARQYHTDLNPDSEAVRKIKTVNMLLGDLIKNKMTLPKKGESFRQRGESFQQSSSEIPPWQTDSRSSNDSVGTGTHRNINYNKKYIYEHPLEAEGGDRSKLRRMTLWSFWGGHGRESMTVFGSSKINQLMADVMRLWIPSSEAVLLSDEAGNFKIIWVAGHDVDTPLEHDSFNGNAFNDRSFEREVERIVRKYK